MMSSQSIWVVDDDQSIRWILERAFQKANISVESFATADEALMAVSQNARLPDAIISDIKMQGTDGLEFMRQITALGEHIPVIVITAHADLETTVNAYEGGAFEYLPKPFDIEEVISVARRAFANRNEPIKKTARPPTEQTGLIGETAAMRNVFRSIGKLSRSEATVLITGESGTGKELIAKALHHHSPRASHPFIALNMAAIPTELMESELFGHEKGAFTGAQERRHGHFEKADGGTLFLDEIGDMPANMQTRLLRVLSERQFYRVGGRQTVRVDVRIIAATHQALDQLVTDGRFRTDLYHRLNVIHIAAPALRHRAPDIPILLRAFLQRAADELKAEQKVATPTLEQALMQMPWPGNVRQLENLARWLTLMSSGRELSIVDLPRDLYQQQTPNTALHWTNELAQWATAALANGDPDIAAGAIANTEITLIKAALEHTNNKKQHAATLLGWGRNTLTRKLKEYHLE